MHPDYLLSQLTSSQLTGWIAYEQLEPSGTGIDDQRMGMICACIMNAVIMANHDHKKGKPKWYEPSHFIPEYCGQEEEQKPKQTADDMLEIMKEIAGVKS